MMDALLTGRGISTPVVSLVEPNRESAELSSHISALKYIQVEVTSAPCPLTMQKYKARANIKGLEKCIQLSGFGRRGELETVAGR